MKACLIHIYITVMFSSCICTYIEWLLERWVAYEQTVSELLDWVMTEAEKFAADVTARGDKGVEDHIKSCEVSMYLF